MDQLSEARAKINRIDAEMARLFEERMHAVESVAEYKAKNDLPILDSAREAQVIERNLALLENEELRPYYRRYLESTMAISRAYQSTLIKDKAARTLTVQTPSRTYPVYFERGGISRIGELFRLDRRVLILTDDGVPAQYAQAVADSAKTPFIYTVKQGESSKSLAELERLCQFLLENEFTRTDCIVAVGGGVVGDLGGLTASVFLRGIDFYNVPTTTLAAVDSAVGGKTAVNLCEVKNVIGSFYQPRAVLIDTDTFSTLPMRQVSSGLCEAVKMAACLDAELFRFFEENEINEDNVEEILYRSVGIKAQITAQDERETGLRKILNFGHTLGHAVESATALHTLTHGECVALGMLPMAKEEARERILAVLNRLSLPTALPCPIDAVLPFLTTDKKRIDEKIVCVVVKEIGSAELVPTAIEEIKIAARSYFEKGAEA